MNDNPIEDELPTEVAQAVKKIKPREREHYVNSKEFEARIKMYYECDTISDDLANDLIKIVNGLSYAPNFINYTYKSDMVGDALVKMLSALRNKKFRLNSGFSPFAYFTTIAFHAFINRIKRENKQHDALIEYRDRVYTDLMIETEGTAGGIYVEPATDIDEDI